MRTTISIADPLLAGAKRQAKERGVTLSVVIEDAVRQLLFETKPVPAEPFKLHTVTGTLVNPHLDMNRISALLEMDDVERYGMRKRNAVSVQPTKRSARKRG